jgi:hypothetical protein
VAAAPEFRTIGPKNAKRRVQRRLSGTAKTVYPFGAVRLERSCSGTYMARSIAIRILCAGLLLAAYIASAQQTQKSSKDLFAYINEAKLLGLSDDQIRKNALNGGWD